MIVQKDEAIAALQNNLHTANEELLEAQTQISSGDEELSQLRNSSMKRLANSLNSR